MNQEMTITSMKAQRTIILALEKLSESYQNALRDNMLNEDDYADLANDTMYVLSLTKALKEKYQAYETVRIAKLQETIPIEEPRNGLERLEQAQETIRRATQKLDGER